MTLADYFFLKYIGFKFKRTLRKHYSKKEVKYNLRLVGAIYRNLAIRYGITTWQLYKYLPLNLDIDPDLDNYAYGVCRVRDCYFVRSKITGIKVNKSKATISLQKTDVTTTTFIHEFGHYLRYLIGVSVALFNNRQALQDFKTICSIVGNNMRIDKYTRRRMFIAGFATEQEEHFARSWEQYMKDGVAPSKEYIKIFKDFRMIIVMDGHKRDERKKFENYEDLSDSFITPEKRKFFGELILGKKSKMTIKKFLKSLIFWVILIILLYLFWKFYIDRVVMKNLLEII